MLKLKDEELHKVYKVSVENQNSSNQFENDLGNVLRLLEELENN